jgi:hypothetical protein
MAKVTLSSMTNIQIAYDMQEPTLADVRKFVELADRLGIPDNQKCQIKDK